MKKKTVYALIDPFDKKIRYIGATSQSIKDRLSGHINKARMFAHMKNSKHSWLLDLIEKDARILVKILREKCKDWAEYEKYYIQVYADTIFNKAEGGEDNTFKKGYKPWNKGGGYYSPETREKMAVAKRGGIQTLEHRMNESKAQCGKVLTKEHVHKVRVGRGKPVLKFDLNNNFIKEYPAASFAAQEILESENPDNEVRKLGRKIRHACNKNRIVNNSKWQFSN